MIDIFSNMVNVFHCLFTNYGGMCRFSRGSMLCLWIEPHLTTMRGFIL